MNQACTSKWQHVTGQGINEFQMRQADQALRLSADLKQRVIFLEEQLSKERREQGRINSESMKALTQQQQKVQLIQSQAQRQVKQWMTKSHKLEQELKSQLCKCRQLASQNQTLQHLQLELKARIGVFERESEDMRKQNDLLSRQNRALRLAVGQLNQELEQIKCTKVRKNEVQKQQKQEAECLQCKAITQARDCAECTQKYEDGKNRIATKINEELVLRIEELVRALRSSQSKCDRLANMDKELSDCIAKYESEVSARQQVELQLKAVRAKKEKCKASSSHYKIQLETLRKQYLQLESGAGCNQDLLWQIEQLKKRNQQLQSQVEQLLVLRSVVQESRRANCQLREQLSQRDRTIWQLRLEVQMVARRINVLEEELHSVAKTKCQLQL